MVLDRARACGISLAVVRSPFLLVASLTAVIATAVACGASGDPLGGPYGGTSGTVSSSNRATSDDAGASATVDAAPPPPACTPGDPPATTPTFTDLYTTYFAPGAQVDCTNGPTCHAEFKAVQTAWSYLAGFGQVGSNPPLFVSPASSSLLWYGGNMPNSGTACNSQAMADLNAWAAAGGQNN